MGEPARREEEQTRVYQSADFTPPHGIPMSMARVPVLDRSDIPMGVRIVWHSIERFGVALVLLAVLLYWNRSDMKDMRTEHRADRKEQTEALGKFTVAIEGLTKATDATARACEANGQMLRELAAKVAFKEPAQPAAGLTVNVAPTPAPEPAPVAKAPRRSQR